MNQIIGFLKDAICSYAEARGKMSDKEWLSSYLHQVLTQKSDKQIAEMVQTITQTLDVFSGKQRALEEARKKGLSAEEWLAHDLQSQGCTEDELRDIVSRTADILQHETGYQDAKLTEAMQSQKGIKDIIKEFGKAVGITAIATAASDESAVMIKEAGREDNPQAEQKDVFRKLLEDGAIAGLKVAISAGLAAASAAEAIPILPVQVLASVAHRVVEEAMVFTEVIRGNMKPADAVLHIKDVAIAAVSAALEEERTGELVQKTAETVGEAVGRYVGSMFGPAGTEIGAIIGALLGQSLTDEKVIETVKLIGKRGLEVLRGNEQTVQKIGKLIYAAVKASRR